MSNLFLNVDCMDKLKGLPSYEDNHFDLAIVDPEYGIGMDGGQGIGQRKKWKSYKTITHQKKNWDKLPPSAEYFKELQRVSKNWIIWGGNYFIDKLGRIEHVISWDKCCEGTSFSHFEIALTSFKGANRKISVPIQRESQRRIHPTQKPVFLYQRLLQMYAEDGDLILDTHVGSASSLVACESLSFKYVGFEIDKEYYQSASKRIKTGIPLIMF